MSSTPTPTPTPDPGVNWFGLDRYLWAWIVGGLFAFGAVIWSMVGIYKHYYYNTNANVRKWVIRVLIMVPVYALAAWAGLAMKTYTLYWDVLREGYESYCIYSFFRFLVAYLGGEVKIVEVCAEKEQREHVAPFNWCTGQWEMGSKFYVNVRWGVLQYVWVRAVCAVATFITALPQVDLYHDGTLFRLDAFYPYVTVATNFSQIWAMYCLVLFYLAMADDLAPIRPVPKFTCVKAVVFMTFWQAMLIAALEHYGYVHATQTYTADDASKGLQDFAICIEMFIAAAAHWYVFPHDEYNAVSQQQADTEALVSQSAGGLLSDQALEYAVESHHHHQHDAASMLYQAPHMHAPASDPDAGGHSSSGFNSSSHQAVVIPARASPVAELTRSTPQSPLL